MQVKQISNNHVLLEITYVIFYNIKFHKSIDKRINFVNIRDTK